MKIESLKQVQAGYINTPLEPMPRLARALGLGQYGSGPSAQDVSDAGGISAGGLYIKRDDLTGLALGGNKARKLNYIVRYALDHGYTALMTFGGVQTNHGRLTAAAAIRFGLKPILILKGAKPDYLSGNLLLDRLMGSDIYFVDTSAADSLPEPERTAAGQRFLEQCAAQITAEYESRGEKVLRIPVGGQTVIGSAGYVQAVPEIMEQMKAMNISAGYLVAGYGSTGTFAGLWAGAKYYHAPFEVIGIPIEPDSRPPEETAAFINELSEYFEMGFTCRAEDLHIEYGPGRFGTAASSDHCGTGTADGSAYGYGGIGYNEPDPVTQEYIALLARTEAIFVDPCYTGKVLHGFVDLLKRGVISAEDGAIFMHTGGAPGLWTREHLDSMQQMFWTEEPQAVSPAADTLPCDPTQKGRVRVMKL